MAFDRSEFLSTFHDEAKDHLQKLNEGLLALEKDPQNPNLLEEMFRVGHTLKGAARMMGFNEIKEISHRIEDIFGAINNKKILLDQELTNVLFKSLDVIEETLSQVVSQQAVTTEWQATVDELQTSYDEYLSPEKKKKTSEKKVKKTTKKKPSKAKAPSKKSPSSAESKSPIETSENVIEASSPTSDSSSDDSTETSDFNLDELTFEKVKQELEEKGLLNVPLEDYIDEKELEEDYSQVAPKEVIKTFTPPAEIEEFIKVPITKINKLLNLVGEMVINKINSNQKIANLRRVSKTTRLTYKKLGDLTSALVNLPSLQGTQTLQELKLSLSELNNDVFKIKEEITKVYDDTAGEVSQLDPIIDELQLRMKQIRMLPVGTVFEMMPRLVRDIAVAQGKKIDLLISGEETELDKKVLESIKGSLIHLLRNSVDHGIESPEERIKLGKDPHGQIKLKAYHKGGNVIIEIADDGRGLNQSKIREQAVRKGIIGPEEVINLPDHEVNNFIFCPGFSTAPIITDISGRGVGLDVVKTDIESLKGNIGISTTKGKGTTFTLQLPLTVAIIQALLIRCENEIFAIPLLSVEESISVNPKEIQTIENRGAIRLRDKTISVLPLNKILNVPAEEKENKEEQEKDVNIVILNSMEKLLGLEVDEIMGEQEIFIKSLDENLGKLKNVSGATVLGNGQVIVILDILDLFESSKEFSLHTGIPHATKPENKSRQALKKKSILIAEDSLTTRELERSILNTHGYDVETAKDGLDALNKIQASHFDLIVSDIEMPRMNGFELCRAIRQNPSFESIPVVIISSLNREEDKRKGIEVGAQAYIVKSSFDQTSLVDTVRRLIG